MVNFKHYHLSGEIMMLASAFFLQLIYLNGDKIMGLLV